MALKSMWSRLFMITCVLYGLFLFVLQLSLRGIPHPQAPSVVDDSQRNVAGRPYDYDVSDHQPSKPLPALSTQDKYGQRWTETGSSMTRNLVSQTNTTISIRGLGANSILMRRLKETRQQIASKMKTVSMFPPRQSEADKNHLPTTAVPFIKMSNDFYIYSAILDRRFRQDYVRVFILCPSAEDEWGMICIFNATHQYSNPRDGLHKADSKTKFTHGQVPVAAKKYVMCENHGKKYGGWILTCPVPQHISVSLSPISLSLSDNGEKLFVENLHLQKIKGKQRQMKIGEHFVNTEDTNTHLENQKARIDLENRIPKRSDAIKDDNAFKFQTEKDVRRKHRQQTYAKTVGGDNEEYLGINFTIGVCVPPLYGEIDLTRVVNFVEMTRILGARQVILYINDIPPDMRQILQDYVLLDPSFLKLIDWDLPVIDTTFASRPRKSVDSSADPTPLPASEVIWNRGQLLAIQHCLYTNMDAFDWLLFMDVDEMLFPRNSFTWNELIHQIMVSQRHKGRAAQNNGQSDYWTIFPPKVAGFVFQSAIFHTDFQSQAQYNIDYFQKMSRAKQTDTARSKLMVRPDRVFEMGIHHLSRTITDDDQIIRVAPDMALVHHYREEETAEMGDYFQEEKDLTFDNSTLKYELLLSEASQSVMNYLGKVMMARRRSHRFPVN